MTFNPQEKRHAEMMRELHKIRRGIHIIVSAVTDRKHPYLHDFIETGVWPEEEEK